VSIILPKGLTTCQAATPLQAINFDVMETAPASELPASLKVGFAVNAADGSEMFQKFGVLGV
jgi:hypothetical protein